MKTKINLIIALAFLVFALTACNFSFSTASISSLNFGKNEKAAPPAASFDVGEKVFAVAEVANAMGNYKMKFNVSYENVPGKNKGESAFTKDINFEGSVPVILSLTLPLPGEYKIEAILSDEQDKELDRKSGTMTVKGKAPAPTENKIDDADHDSDDKSEK
ncbi:MAG: hypothetical protein M3Q99_00110 [Acidobacteriota bacterium]|nr:hypothetical protein [Acidobacteriota bacterium]